MTLPPIDLQLALAGLIVGLLVGLTGMGGGALMTPILVLIFGVQPLAVGSGALMMVCLLFLYPRLRANQLVGTDIVQAIPLVGSAALGHLLYGDFRLILTASLLIGAIPGVYLGARASAHAPARLVRRAL